MIYAGENLISSVYFGDTAVSKIFAGDDLIYGGSETMVYNLENPIVQEYMKVSYTNDPRYNVSYIRGYCTPTDYSKSKPAPIVIGWPAAAGADSVRIDVSEENDFSSYISFTDIDVSDNKYNLYNLKPGTMYYYRVVSTTNSVDTVLVSRSFQTSGRLRMLKIDNINNVRDLGGWDCGGGRKIKYGLLFRGSHLDGGYGTLTESGKNVLADIVGVQTELDLDEDDNQTLDYYSRHQIVAYEPGLSSPAWQPSYCSCIRQIITNLSNSRPTYFHCQAGADRTGTLAFLIEGAVGVSESDMSKDYELTSLWIYGAGTYRQRNEDIGGTFGYPSMVEWIKTNYPGDTLNESICMYLTAIGITEAEINSLRNLLLTV